MQQGRGEGAKGLHIRYPRLRSSPVDLRTKENPPTGLRYGGESVGTQSGMVRGQKSGRFPSSAFFALSTELDVPGTAYSGRSCNEQGTRNDKRWTGSWRPAPNLFHSKVMQLSVLPLRLFKR